MRIIQAQLEHMDWVRELFREYQHSLDSDCCFSDFEAELSNLPGSYASPKGAIFIAIEGEVAVACSAIRAKEGKEENEAELKRLYVKKDYRGHGLGRDIFNTSLTAIKKMGYKTVFLETVPEKMQAAQGLYQDYGFQPISSEIMEQNTSDESIQCLRYYFDSDK